MGELLTEQGFSLYVKSKTGKGSWQSVALPQLPLEKGMTELCTKADIRARHGLRTDTAALQWLLNQGAVRIQLGGKTLWQVSPQRYRIPISVPLTGSDT